MANNFFNHLSSVLGDSFKDFTDGIIHPNNHEEIELFRSRWGDINKSPIAHDNYGFRFGNVAVDEEPNYHCAVISASGGGKTASCVLPFLQSLHGQSVIVHDESKELYTLSSGWLAKQNYRIYCLDLNNSAISHKLNILKFIETKADVNRTSALILTSTNSTSSDKYWQNAGESLLSVLMEITLALPKEQHTMSKVLELAHLLGSEPEKVDELVSKYASNDEDFMRRYKYQISQSVQSSRTFASVLSTVVSSLKIFESPEVAEVMSGHEFPPLEEIRKQRTAIFLFNSLHLSRPISSVLGIVIHFISKKLMESIPPRGSRPCYFILDETSTLAHALSDSLGLTLSNARKYKVMYMIVIQSITALKYNFHDYQTILNNCAVKLFIASGLDLETSKMLEELVGRQTIIDKNGQERTAPLITSEQIRTMKKYESICLVQGYLPLRLQLVPYYQQMTLNFRSKYPPAQYRQLYH